ncbi:MAG: hypothetical protein WBP29_00820 [Candidatus Zixiibacteriota bacterium]
MDDTDSKMISNFALQRLDRSISDEQWIEGLLEPAPYAIMGMNGEHKSR